MVQEGKDDKLPLACNQDWQSYQPRPQAQGSQVFQNEWESLIMGNNALKTTKGYMQQSVKVVEEAAENSEESCQQKRTY